ncbi:MAG TPA: IclR family transcriptional regulator [Candidatus Dormibacteraeota bacterium]|nr:IclR family transcriptional regulator [Candidatus Dormibacteraeota bacterium]
MKVKRTTDGKYVVEAVDSALNLLEAFRDSEELSLATICRRAGLNKSRTFRLLHTLAQRSYVERTLDGLRYKLGLKLFEHATHFRRDLKRVAQPFMQQLQERFNETTNLAVLHNGEVLYVDLLESSRPFRMAAMIGSRMPIASTSLGKAMVAYANEKEWVALLSRVPAGELRKLKKELAAVRLRGYALDRGENEPGVACIGAPVFNGTGATIAAVSVSGPMSRMLKQEKEVGKTLVRACKDMSRYMGFVGETANYSPNGLKRPLRAANTTRQSA